MTSSEENHQPQIPIIDFSGIVGTTNPSSEQWNHVATQVVQALQSHGCFQALLEHSFTPELRANVLSSLRDELFSLPLENKLKNTAVKPFNGYLGQMPGLDSESLAIVNPIPHGISNFVHQLWPHSGNPNFSELAQEVSKKAIEVELMVRKMVMEELRVKEKHALQVSEKTWHLLRFWEYGKQAAAKEEEVKKGTGYIAHRDTNTLSIVWQLNEVNGLELQSREGGWIMAKPSPSTIIVIAGNSLQAWTNGRIYAPVHRVVVSNNNKDNGGESRRYSVILFSILEDDFIIEAPEELVDNQHPRLFKPFTSIECVYFSASEEGKKTECNINVPFGLNA